jgi:hypothetical protein
VVTVIRTNGYNKLVTLLKIVTLVMVIVMVMVVVSVLPWFA